MAECYLCAAYIAPGAGYRRNVQTGTSTRVYAMRHGGASFGMYAGLRTLCVSCAEANDRVNSGVGVRLLLLFLGWGISGFIGWQLITAGSGAFAVIAGLLCMLGIPVFAIGGVIEHQRRTGIINEIGAISAPPQIDLSVQLARRTGETIEEWLDRNPTIQAAEDREFWETATEMHPPQVGQSIDDWFTEVRAVAAADGTAT